MKKRMWLEQRTPRQLDEEWHEKASAFAHNSCCCTRNEVSPAKMAGRWNIVWQIDERRTTFINVFIETQRRRISHTFENHQLFITMSRMWSTMCQVKQKESIPRHAHHVIGETCPCAILIRHNYRDDDDETTRGFESALPRRWRTNIALRWAMIRRTWLSNT